MPDSSLTDTAVTDARSTVERLLADARSRKDNIQKQIDQIQANGAGWEARRKVMLAEAKEFSRRGQKAEAQQVMESIATTDKEIGTPQERQARIDGLSPGLRTSNAVAVYRGIAPGTGKVLDSLQQLNAQYQPRSFDDNLNAQARGIIEKFAAFKQGLRTQLESIDGSIELLEKAIQVKLQAAGYAPQKIDLTDPQRVEFLRKIAPDDMAAREKAEVDRRQLNLKSQQADRDAKTAIDTTQSIATRREKLNVDRLGTDYLASTNDGFIAQIQVDKQRFQQGKTDLDLQFESGAISADLYAAKLKQLTLETDTLRNAMLPLRSATTGFFNDIFSGQGVFDGLGGAVRNLTVNILKNFQDLIAKQLGQQLFGSLLDGAENIQETAAKGEGGILGGLLRSIGLVTPGSQPKTNAGIAIGLNNPIIPPSSDFIGSIDTRSAPKQPGLGDSLARAGFGIGLQLLGIPAFANGGMVTSPTLALVGEGLNNEAIVPLPNGRSIPVDLRGNGGGSGTTNNVNSSVAVTIQNNGNAKETSRGDADAVSQRIRSAVVAEVMEMKRSGLI